MNLDEASDPDFHKQFLEVFNKCGGSAKKNKSLGSDAN